MTINELIVETLEDVGVPVQFMTYEGTENTYITFFCFLEQGFIFSDDSELLTDFNVQIDIWSKGDSLEVEDKVRQALKENGFIKTGIYDDYEKDTKIYHKVLRYKYITENKEE